ncbi:MAG: SRPBCC family protein [Halofilum sp. (in: g-proteobacteria)]|nr:SRPBCC family protein [Halofilum sp. (in: g-proteobacteria)]
MHRITTTRRTTARATPAAAFDRFVHLELADIMRGFGPLAAVSGTSGQTGPWDRAGSERLIHTDDGHAVRQRVLRCERPRRFRYRIDRFPAPIDRLVEEAISEWRFDATDGHTRIEWTYTYCTRGLLATVILLPIVKLLWAGYMSRIIAAVRRTCEAPG